MHDFLGQLLHNQISFPWFGHQKSLEKELVILLIIIEDFLINFYSMLMSSQKYRKMINYFYFHNLKVQIWLISFMGGRHFTYNTKLEMGGFQT
jgi:hypothetical protein